MNKMLAAALAAAMAVAPAMTALPGTAVAAQENQKKIWVPKGKAQPGKAQQGKNVNNNKRPPVGRPGNNDRANNRGHNVHRDTRVVRNNYYYRGRSYGYGWRSPYYYGWGAPAAVGFATGAIVGAAVSQPRAVYRTAAPANDVPPAGGYAAFSPGYMDYCSGKYRSFDPDSGTYLGYDGYRHYCQ